MKYLFNFFLGISLSVLLFSCGEGTEKSSENETKNEDSTAIVASKDSTLFKVMLIKHAVANFDKWKIGYDLHDSVRKAYGLTNLDLTRRIDSSNIVCIALTMTDLQKAKDFTVLPNLKETMVKYGVLGVPQFEYYNVIRNNDAKIDTKDRIIVTHRVKDFDKWIKVYDQEGIATRASEGMVDRVLARGVEDPNMVYLIFAITDMTKTKETIASESKKKIMTDAGAEGIPRIEYYRQ